MPDLSSYSFNDTPLKREWERELLRAHYNLSQFTNMNPINMLCRLYMRVNGGQPYDCYKNSGLVVGRSVHPGIARVSTMYTTENKSLLEILNYVRTKF